MKSILLGLMALVPLMGVSPAQATTYTYAVDYVINIDTVTGDIVLNCNACAVSSSSLVSWSLSLSVFSAFSASGTTAAFSGTDLTATPTEISFVPTTGAYADFSSSAGCYDFGATACPGDTYDVTANPSTFFDANNKSTDAGAQENLSFATLPIATTPLPATLPLYVTVLGIAGLLGWRRNRKNAAAIAA